MRTEIIDFVHQELWPLSVRVADTWHAADGIHRIGEPQVLIHSDQDLIVHTSEPTPGLKIAEFCGEVLFPYQFNDVYDKLDPVTLNGLEKLGMRVDPEGRPEAIIDLKYDTAEEHFKHISTIKPLLKLMPRVEYHADLWNYDSQVELDNIVYHMSREGVDTSKALEYYGPDYYSALALVSKYADLRRTDYWFEDQFMGHSLWAISPDKEELYWVTPVMARNEVARKKLRIGNLMMLKEIERAYEQGFKRINLGVDEMDYKNNFWGTRRVYRPGLRRIQNEHHRNY